MSAGAQVIQLFDSWAGALAPADYERAVLPYTRRIFAALADAVPRIHFAQGNPALLPLLARAECDVVSVDWRLPLDGAWDAIGPELAIQGNLDPAVCLAPFEVIAARAREILDRAAGRPGHIFNLGHGVLPETDPDALARLVDLVQLVVDPRRHVADRAGVFHLRQRVGLRRVERLVERLGDGPGGVPADQVGEGGRPLRGGGAEHEAGGGVPGRSFAKMDMGAPRKQDRRLAEPDRHPVGMIDMEMSFHADTPAQRRAGQQVVFLRRAVIDGQNNTRGPGGFDMQGRPVRRYRRNIRCCRRWRGRGHGLGFAGSRRSGLLRGDGRFRWQRFGLRFGGL